jgi:UDP-GlcNAc:undecaprenyl-phosphate GlcNAc-1-phosphate transferase
LHTGAVPLVGGLAMGLAFLLLYGVGRPLAEPSHFFGVAAAIMLTLVGGTLDDRHGLRASLKFAFQITAALLIALWGGALLTHFGELVGPAPLSLGRWSLAITVVCIVGLMNAINMTDGLDGLAGTQMLAACLGFGYAAVSAGDTETFTVVCLVTGAVAAFLVHNARVPGGASARVYMGDAGSLMLGLLAAWLAIRLAMSQRPGLAPITAVWIVALPLADMGTVMVRRLLRGKSPFIGDREHLHHLLLDFGMSPQRTTAVLFAASIALGAVGIAAERAGIPQYAMFAVYLAYLSAHGVGAELASRRLRLGRAQSSADVEPAVDTP